MNNKKLLNSEQLTITEEHLVVIQLLQSFYHEFKLIPSTRAIINYAKNKQTIIELDGLLFAKLFPKGIAQACKLAELPDSPRCL